MQPSQSAHQITKKALFGMRARAAENKMLGEHFPGTRPGKVDPVALDSFRRIRKELPQMSMPQLIDSTKGALRAIDQAQAQEAQQAEQGMHGLRNQMSPGYRYTYQKPQPSAPAPLRGALPPTERENSRLVQQQIAYNNQNPVMYASSSPATEQQSELAAAGRGYHSVDSTGAVRYSPASSQQPQAQPDYEQAKANLLRMNPNLGIAGHADNTRFINHLKTQYGDNYREQMQKDPGLLSKAYSSMNPTNQNQLVSTAPSLPKAAQDCLVDFQDREEEEHFRKTAEALGVPVEQAEMHLCALKSTKLAADRSSAFMNHMRKELLKLSAETSNCMYSTQEIVKITESPENFQKAAMLEAGMFFKGLADALVKAGKDESFLEGILKEAEDFSEAVGAALPSADSSPLKDIASTIGEGARKMLDQTKLQGGNIVDTASEGLGGLGKALGEGAQQTKDLGKSLLDTTKETAGRIGEKLPAAKDQLAATAQEGLKRGKDFLANITSPLTNEDDRHQIVPGMGNQFIGAAGGALLSALLGGQLGLRGPAAWLVPLLGGAAGYHYLPKLMNMWKDAPGTGVNATPAPVGNYYQRNPLVPVQVNQPDASNPQTSASPLAQQQFNFNQKAI